MFAEWFSRRAVVDWLIGPTYEDPRTKNWPLMDIRYPLSITMTYLVSIALGNRMMRRRKPFRLRFFATIHNAILFCLSLYMCLESLRQSYVEFDWSHSFDFACPIIKPGSFSPAAQRLANVLWIHYISKAYEFVDTLIMVFKKNTQQITFLHVYHHATTFFPVWWSVIKYGPGGAAYFCCALNSFIHIGMYGYYLLAGLGYKWTVMKPFITYSQMIQFLCFITQASYMLLTDCYRPRLTVVFLLFQCIVFFVLFSNFAYHTYWHPKRKTT